jgi:hypothetical protein
LFDPKSDSGHIRITPETGGTALEGVRAQITGVFTPPSTLLLNTGLLSKRPTRTALTRCFRLPKRWCWGQPGSDSRAGVLRSD